EVLEGMRIEELVECGRLEGLRVLRVGGDGSRRQVSESDVQPDAGGPCLVVLPRGLDVEVVGDAVPADASRETHALAQPEISREEESEPVPVPILARDDVAPVSVVVHEAVVGAEGLVRGFASRAPEALESEEAEGSLSLEDASEDTRMEVAERA